MFRFAIAMLLAAPLWAQVKITPQGKDKVSIEIDGKPFTDFYVGPQAPKPYLHPLRTADGKTVTRGYPMIPGLPGEAQDEPHHKGLWFAHGDVNGYNFWANDPETPLNPKYKGRGNIVLEKVGKISSGKASGSITATFLWNTTPGNTILVETRTMTFYSDPQMRRFDFDASLSPQQEVTFGDTKDGMFAIREHLGQARRVGGLLRSPRWRHIRSHRDGPSRQSALSHLLARARLRSAGCQHFWPPRF